MGEAGGGKGGRGEGGWRHTTTPCKTRLAVLVGEVTTKFPAARALAKAFATSGESAVGTADRAAIVVDKSARRGGAGREAARARQGAASRRITHGNVFLAMTSPIRCMYVFDRTAPRDHPPGIQVAHRSRRRTIGYARHVRGVFPMSSGVPGVLLSLHAALPRWHSPRLSDGRPQSWASQSIRLCVRGGRTTAIPSSTHSCPVRQVGRCHHVRRNANLREEAVRRTAFNVREKKKRKEQEGRKRTGGKGQAGRGQEGREQEGKRKEKKAVAVGALVKLPASETTASLRSATRIRNRSLSNAKAWTGPR